jgi:hypothetical protein
MSPVSHSIGATHTGIRINPAASLAGHPIVTGHLRGHSITPGTPPPAAASDQSFPKRYMLKGAAPT